MIHALGSNGAPQDDEVIDDLDTPASRSPYASIFDFRRRYQRLRFGRLMGTLIFAGLLYAHVLGFFATAGFLLQTWRNRPEEKEYVAAGLMTLGLSGYALNAARVFHLTVEPGNDDAIMQSATNATFWTIASLIALVYFAVLYLSLSHQRKILAVAGTLACLYSGLLLTDGWWAAKPQIDHALVIGGLQFNLVVFNTTPAATSFYALAGLLITGVVVALGISYVRGRTESLPVFGGAVMLLLSTIHDSSVTTGLFEGVSLVPFGYSVFVFGMTVTLVSRYTRRSHALERRTAELVARTDQLRTSYIELEQTQDKVVQSEQLAAVGRIANLLNRRVRDRLETLRQSVEIIKAPDPKGELAKQKRAQLQTIETEVNRLARLINRLLQYTRSQSPTESTLDLNELLNQILAQNSPSSLVRVDCHCRAPLIRTRARPVALRQLLEDVIENALSFIGEQGLLSVHAEGVPKGEPAHVQVVIEAKSETDLSGGDDMPSSGKGESHHKADVLGLALSEQILHAHGGHLIMGRETPSLTKVTMSLPIKHAAALSESEQDSDTERRVHGQRGG